MKTMKYGFINTTEFNKGIKSISKDNNLSSVKKIYKGLKSNYENTTSSTNIVGNISTK
ncbi:hypothetical protein [Clostridium sp.]|uniref:hypothetical protein n=1 Tax=Clostridium sp. TaxID=1506 RepID=UPI002611BDF9|nr:hypothetical protein [uncultured Clostridium sp.]